MLVRPINLKKTLTRLCSRNSIDSVSTISAILSCISSNPLSRRGVSGHRYQIKIIEEFQKCHLDHPIGKFFGDCTELKVKLLHCFRQEKAVKRKVNFEQSKKLQERLKAIRKDENAET
ncbi:COX assembly mitochondrial protein 2 homolog isoform X2 [Brassica napus]|uniref:COX assembly mitochondrial protein 2 homolog isoform X1 n=1 Tax=Brassica napus TaxID=3708 RepID=UPI0020791364|nr:COX assembly mitochondrial protein 2 homolog isoform X1 [Brassica napus]XP_048626942.1 COX assembly mitochondrial protein 2 homolog isoform X2 [Brassica napus]